MEKKRILIAVSLILLVAASILLKWVITETVIYHSWPGWNDRFELEKLNYIVDATIVIILYSIFESHIKSLTRKIGLSLTHAVVYLVILMSCNYGWGLLAWREIWDIPYFKYVKIELAYYFRHASPCFHWVFIATFAACIGISVFRRMKQPMCFKIKNYLIKMSRKNKTVLSQESIYSILLKVFREYMTDAEFEEIREEYIDMMYNQALFPGYIESLNDSEED